jgi:hypothetical protein
MVAGVLLAWASAAAWRTMVSMSASVRKDSALLQLPVHPAGADGVVGGAVPVASGPLPPPQAASKTIDMATDTAFFKRFARFPAIEALPVSYAVAGTRCRPKARS